jgi:hypothetical protein
MLVGVRDNVFEVGSVNKGDLSVDLYHLRRSHRFQMCFHQSIDQQITTDQPTSVSSCHDPVLTIGDFNLIQLAVGQYVR